MGWPRHALFCRVSLDLHFGSEICIFVRKNEKNLGVSNTFNKALTMIRTPYLVRIDQDDVNLENRIEDQIAYLDKHKDIDIVCSWEYVIDSHGNKIGKWKRVLDNYGSFLGYVLIGICPIWHPSITLRTKSLVDVGGFNDDYARAEDFEVTARLALNRCGAAILPKSEHIIALKFS